MNRDSNHPIRLALYDPARVVYLCRRRPCPRWLNGWVAGGLLLAVVAIVLWEVSHGVV
jgi:hypothetical protein